MEGRHDPRSAAPARGVLTRQAPDGSIEHRRILPESSLSGVVAHFWSIRWSLRTPFTAQTLPHPSAHLVLEAHGQEQRAELAGIHRRRFDKRLEGEGWVFGVKFRPAMVQPFLTAFSAAPMASFTDRVTPIAEVLGRAADEWVESVFGAADLDARMASSSAFLSTSLRGRPLPERACEIERIRDLVERMAVDRSILRVEDAAAVAHLDVRTMQRAFRTYLGVSPKWVIRRYRLHEAAEQLKGDRPPSLTALASSLGYADQSHFARDFKLAVGRTPREFSSA